MLQAFWDDWFNQSEEAKQKFARTRGQGGWYKTGSEFGDDKEYFHFRVNHAHMDAATTAEFHAGFSLLDNQLEMWDLPRNSNLADHVLRIIKYHGAAKGEEHADFSLMSAVMGQSAPGLEVRSRVNYRWSAADDFPVVLWGKMLETWNPRYEATVHRVNGSGPRLSAVFFYLPPADFELKPGYTADMFLKDNLPGTY